MFIEPMLASTTSEKKRATLSDKTGYVLEPKHDGMRAIISKHNGEVKIYSRVGLEYQEHLPALVEQASKLLDGTVLDGELMVVKAWEEIGGRPVAVADFNQTMRIMGSGPEKAIARQVDHEIQFCAFDILKVGAVPFWSDHYELRMIMLEGLLSDFPMSSVFQNVYMRDWDDTTINELWDAGIEGAILKKTDSVYIPGKRRANTWYKVKAELTADVVVMGFTDAKEGKTGKWLGKVGALIFGAYNDQQELVEVGQCSGMTDAERDRWTSIRDYDVDNTLRVIEVKYNDLVGSGEFGTPRHPQFKTERIDKRPEDCLMEQFRLS
jgi:ATP-dependent DNA ligase